MFHIGEKIITIGRYIRYIKYFCRSCMRKFLFIFFFVKNVKPTLKSFLGYDEKISFKTYLQIFINIIDFFDNNVVITGFKASK